MEQKRSQLANSNPSEQRAVLANYGQMAAICDGSGPVGGGTRAVFLKREVVE